MTEQRRAGGRTDGRETTGKTLKRRGILAAAGVAVAGIVAKQASESVAAISDVSYVATGGSGTAFDVATSGYFTGVSATGKNYGVYSSVGTGYGVFAVMSGGTAPNYAGVYGGATGAGNFGVHGVGGVSLPG